MSVIKEKWLTDLTAEELRAKILPTPHRPFEVDGIPVFINMEKQLLPEEVFKRHPEFPIEVSNLGRIKYNDTILLQIPDEDNNDPYGYLKVRGMRGIMESQLVYRLVAVTWCERPDPKVYTTVHHISNNGMDNRVSNLLWVTPEQHAEIHPWIKGYKQ